MTITFSAFTATRGRRLTLIGSGVTFVVFLALIGVMFYLRWASELWPVPFHFGSMLMSVFELMLTMCAAVCGGMAWHASEMEDREPTVRWLAVAITSWLTFLFFEIVEWTHLVYIEGLGPDTSFGSTFLALTGLHWVAGIIAAGWYTYVAVDSRRRDIFAATMFTGFLSFVWTILWILLYVPNGDLSGF